MSWIPKLPTLPNRPSISVPYVSRDKYNEVVDQRDQLIMQNKQLLVRIASLQKVLEQIQQRSIEINELTNTSL